MGLYDFFFGGPNEGKHRPDVQEFHDRHNADSSGWGADYCPPGQCTPSQGNTITGKTFNAAAFLDGVEAEHKQAEFVRDARAADAKFTADMRAYQAAQRHQPAQLQPPAKQLTEGTGSGDAILIRGEWVPVNVRHK